VLASTSGHCKEFNLNGDSFVNLQHLIVNHTAIHVSGYSWDAIHCCYYVIERVEQPLESYDMNADSVVK